MATGTEPTPIRVAWANFVTSVQILLVPQTNDRPLDQYLSFRAAVLGLVQGEQSLAELDSAWTATTNQPLPDIRNTLLLELQAFPLAVEVAQKTGTQEEAKGWGRKLLGRASTVSSSVKDLMDNLPPYAKNALTLFRELIDLFKGTD
ncbi:MAG TPA: hypothetical protein VFN26_15420 [Candidatus Acidoferrum sp.]|nr:hypothetical protein [Candidatus Acidoferrum sp.]